MGSSDLPSVSEIILQPDGKILVGVSFSSCNGSIANRIIRLSIDGSIDASFSSGSGFSYPPGGVIWGLY